MKVWPVRCRRRHNEEGSLSVLTLCCCHLQIENISNSSYFVLVILTVFVSCTKSDGNTECHEQRRQGTNLSSLLFLDALLAYMIFGRSHRPRILIDPQKLKVKCVQVCCVYD